ncbi:hypothetical protein [Streptomyces sp. NPDC002265]
MITMRIAGGLLVVATPAAATGFIASAQPTHTRTPTVIASSKHPT